MSKKRSAWSPRRSVNRGRHQVERTELPHFGVLRNHQPTRQGWDRRHPPSRCQESRATCRGRRHRRPGTSVAVASYRSCSSNVPELGGAAGEDRRLSRHSPAVDHLRLNRSLQASPLGHRASSPPSARRQNDRRRLFRHAMVRPTRLRSGRGGVGLRVHVRMVTASAEERPARCNVTRRSSGARAAPRQRALPIVRRLSSAASA